MLKREPTDIFLKDLHHYVVYNTSDDAENGDDRNDGPEHDGACIIDV